MFEDVDWSYRAGYMFEKHGVTAEQANEALRDPMRAVVDPDYASKSGEGTRIIGYSPSFGDVLSIIVVLHGGREYGANGWRANDKDRAIYREVE